MNTMLAAFLGGWEIVLILAVVLILFGAKKLPELARGLGQGIKEFKKATREVTDEIQHAGEEDPKFTALPPKKPEPWLEQKSPEGSSSETPASAPPQSAERKS